MSYLTVNEVAQLLQVPKSWVYDRTRDGRIPCLKVGKYVRFDRVQIDAWLREQQAPAPTAI